GEKGALGFARSASENRIAMRKASEAGDHVAVALGEIEESFEGWPALLLGEIAQLGEPRHGQILALQILGMLQHQVDEDPLDGRGRLIPPPLQAIADQLLRTRASGKGLRRATVDHAR